MANGRKAGKVNQLVLFVTHPGQAEFLCFICPLLVGHPFSPYPAMTVCSTDAPEGCGMTLQRLHENE